MSLVTDEDMSNDAFAFRDAKEIAIGFARALCIRITYLGELGYELYIPAEQAVARLRAPGRGGRAGRPRARRAEGAGQPPDGEGLPRLRPRHRQHRHRARGRARASRSRWDKPGGFIGRDAALAQKALGVPTKRLVQVLVHDPEPMMFHAEPVRRDGVMVGYIRAASYGHTLGGAVGLAMIETRRRAAQPGLDRRWRVDGRDRRRHLPGHGVAPPALRPHEREDQDLTGYASPGLVRRATALQRL